MNCIVRAADDKFFISFLSNCNVIRNLSWLLANILTVTTPTTSIDWRLLLLALIWIQCLARELYLTWKCTWGKVLALSPYLIIVGGLAAPVDNVELLNIDIWGHSLESTLMHTNNRMWGWYCRLHLLLLVRHWGLLKHGWRWWWVHIFCLVTDGINEIDLIHTAAEIRMWRACASAVTFII